jgi:hypothetical protein
MSFMPRLNGRRVFFMQFCLAAIALFAVPDLAFAVPQGGGGGQNTGLVEFDYVDFAGSGNCAWCHTDLYDSQGRDVSIQKHWRSTMMANASKDPLWQAKVQSEVLRNPHVQGVKLPLQVSASLLFQTAGYRFVEDLRSETNPLIDFFGGLYDDADKTPETVSSIEVTVTRPPLHLIDIPR